jgi:hypothetical protein
VELIYHDAVSTFLGDRNALARLIRPLPLTTPTNDALLELFSSSFDVPHLHRLSPGPHFFLIVVPYMTSVPLWLGCANSS